MPGIYVHIPFCKSKCIYCDFYSIALPSLIPDFCNALKKEIESRSNTFSGKTINTIYFGGGTPSILEIENIEKILSKIHKNYIVANNAEITLEANPENISLEYLVELKRIGINRLSIGIQSFDDEILKFLKRRHSASNAIECVKTAKECGFDNISIDLIYGITGLSNEMWRKELITAFSLPITHLSCYCLGIEEGTLLHRYYRENRYTPTNDDTCLRQFLDFDKMSAENGFTHYEISNAGKNGWHSKHNSSYWNRSEYLGFGPSAHSFVANSRSWNIENTSEYIKCISEGKPYSTSETLTSSDILEEYIMLGLRTAKGIKLDKTEELFGIIKSNKLRKAISKLNPAHIHFDGNSLSLTANGMFVSDNIILILLQEL
ncbi:MAG: radical SAM family heme chaperone HemW [Bacteroidales bacterium]|nr:radical SAM family heme chaperone HemW [Bacteroidales bacterium]